MPETTRRAASDSRGVSAVIAQFFLAQRQRAGANADCDEYANRSQNSQKHLQTFSLRPIRQQDVLRLRRHAREPRAHLWVRREIVPAFVRHVRIRI
jgi:hypothetical protein